MTLTKAAAQSCPSTHASGRIAGSGDFIRNQLCREQVCARLPASDAAQSGNNAGMSEKRGKRLDGGGTFSLLPILAGVFIGRNPRIEIVRGGDHMAALKRPFAEILTDWRALRGVAPQRFEARSPWSAGK